MKTPVDSKAGSYMTFSAGAAHYSLPIEFVRYITSLDAIKPRMTPDSKGKMYRVFDFEGSAIALFRFTELVGADSQIDESCTLIELLRQRRQDHIDWIDALDHSIRTSEPFSKATDPHKCAFGLWYDRYKPIDAELKSIMEQFDAPHKRIHSLAQRLLSLAVDEHKMEEAIRILDEERFTTLKNLLKLFDQAEARLQSMIKPVAMIVDLGGKLYALELDNIEDIHEFTDAHWLANAPGQHQEQPCYDGFFQKGESDLFIKIDPYRLIS